MDVQKNKRGWTEKHELEKCGIIQDGKIGYQLLFEMKQMWR